MTSNLTASILSLGTRTDAATWKSGVESLGGTIAKDIRAPVPSVNDIKEFFASSEQWLFIAGHFSNGELYNQAHQDGDTSNVVVIKFQNDRVILNHGTNAAVNLVKGTDFSQHTNCKSVFWGGCNTNSDTSQVATFRTLFGNHTLIGWKGITGWQILNVVMGGFGNNSPNPSQDFFDRLGTNHASATSIRNAWLDAANEAQWGDTGQTDAKFSVIDPDGSGFRIHNNTVGSDPAFP